MSEPAAAPHEPTLRLRPIGPGWLAASDRLALAPSDRLALAGTLLGWLAASDRLALAAAEPTPTL
jgi:hypothetical protein